MLLFLTQAQIAQRPPVSQGNAMLFVFIAMFLIMYLLIIKPQRQKQLEHDKMIRALKKNDEVITIGGIHGTIINVKENTVILRIADNVKIELQKNAIAGLKKDKVEVLGEGVETKT